MQKKSRYKAGFFDCNQSLFRGGVTILFLGGIELLGSTTSSLQLLNMNIAGIIKANVAFDKNRKEILIIQVVK